MTIHDISNTGLLLETGASLAEGQKFNVDLPEIGVTQAKVVWASARYFGCRFDAPVPKAAVSAALLRNPIPLADPESEERAWEALGAHIEETKSATDPKELSFAARMRLIVGASLVLWTLIFWGLSVV